MLLNVAEARMISKKIKIKKKQTILNVFHSNKIRPRFNELSEARLDFPVSLSQL